MKFFENPSVSAFFGAFFAFLLVLLIDRIRLHKKIKIIPQLVKINIEIANDKIETVSKKLNSLTKDKLLIPSSMMKFAISEIKQIELEVLDRLKPIQKITLDAICHFLNDVDSILDDSDKSIDEYRRVYTTTGIENPLLNEILLKITNNYTDSISMMKRAVFMSDLYLEKRYDDILNTNYEKYDSKVIN